MAEDLYSDQETSESTTEENSGNEPVTMLSKSIFPGKECKPGDILKLEVVSVDRDQIAVKAADGGYEDESEEEDEEETEESSPGEEMESESEIPPMNSEMAGGMSQMSEMMQ